METLQNVQKLLQDYPLIGLISLICGIIMLPAIIAYEVARHYQKKKCNKYHGDYLIEKDRYLNVWGAHIKLSTEYKELKAENAHILKVNQGMCLRKESISKEIIDDLNLRKTAIGEALRVVREGHFNINAPDVANVVTETADGVYSFLTGKA